jgi:uncharacterized iron-regulated membrane protein
MSPLSRILASLLAALALVGAFFFGLVVIALAAGLGALAWLFLALRMWWLRRRLDRGNPPAGRNGAKQPGAAHAPGGNVIEADYEVVSRREDE